MRNMHLVVGGNCRFASSPLPRYICFEYLARESEGGPANSRAGLSLSLSLPLAPPRRIPLQPPHSHRRAATYAEIITLRRTARRTAPNLVARRPRVRNVRRACVLSAPRVPPPPPPPPATPRGSTARPFASRGLNPTSLIRRADSGELAEASFFLFSFFFFLPTRGIRSRAEERSVARARAREERSRGKKEGPAT